MKLHCAGTLQKKLGVQYKPAPAPLDPLNSWYASVIPDTHVTSILLTLTAVHFTVLLWDLQPNQLADLDRYIVQRIREALQSYQIPQDIIDRYIPKDTVAEKCGAATGTASARMTVVSNQVRKLLRKGKTPQEVEDHINTTSISARGEMAGTSPAAAILALLQKRAPFVPREAVDPVPAMELEVSLDLLIYQARRTLIVPADITFYTLHQYLQQAYRWADCHLHEFILPRKRGREYEQHILDENIDSCFPDPHDVQDREARLKDYLKARDSFQYLYDFGDSWALHIRVSRLIPSCTMDLPLCTLCDGAAPPEDVGGVYGFAAFYKIVQNSKAPEYKDTVDWVGSDWFQPDTTDDINRRIHNLSSWADTDLDC